MHLGGSVAFEMLQKNPAIGMNAGVKEPPSVTGYYWTKKWYQFWRKTIKIIKDFGAQTKFF